MASMKDDATQFAEFDADGNAALDFEEFLAMQPTKIREAHSVEEADDVSHACRAFLFTRVCPFGAFNLATEALLLHWRIVIWDVRDVEVIDGSKE